MNYLLDHLYRACKISKRQSLQSTQSECEFNVMQPSHNALWLSVYPDGAEMSAENVSNVSIHANKV